MLRLARKAPAQTAHSENPMNSLHYIGFDVHKKAISFCVKTAAGEIVEDSAGRRQKPSALPTARAFGRANTKSCLRRKNFERSGDHPAVPRQLGDWAEESRLPMLLTVCIEAGRKTLTHTSWTGLTPVSRKWMSGQAAALAALNDRWPFANLTAPSPLRGPSLPSARRPPSPLDFYLSWMSPVIPVICPRVIVP